MATFITTAVNLKSYKAAKKFFKADVKLKDICIVKDTNPSEHYHKGLYNLQCLFKIIT
jgi:hypothetical protein